MNTPAPVQAAVLQAPGCGCNFLHWGRSFPCPHKAGREGRRDFLLQHRAGRSAHWNFNKPINRQFWSLVWISLNTRGCFILKHQFKVLESVVWYVLQDAFRNLSITCKLWLILNFRVKPILWRHGLNNNKLLYQTEISLYVHLLRWK